MEEISKSVHDKVMELNDCVGFIEAALIVLVRSTDVVIQAFL